MVSAVVSLARREFAHFVEDNDPGGRPRLFVTGGNAHDSRKRSVSTLSGTQGIECRTHCSAGKLMSQGHLGRIVPDFEVSVDASDLPIAVKLTLLDRQA